MLSAALAIVGRFCVNITFNIGLQYGAELIPTVVRAQGIAYVHIAGYVASIISPYIVDLVIRMRNCFISHKKRRRYFNGILFSIRLDSVAFFR